MKPRKQSLILIYKKKGKKRKIIIVVILLTAKEGEEIDFTCELDEYAQLVKDFKESGLIKDHRKGFIHNYKNSFIGKEAVDWLMLSKKIGKYKALCIM